MSEVCVDETQSKSVGGHLDSKGGEGVIGNCRSNILSDVAGGLRLGKDSVSPSGEDAMGDKVNGNTP
jgi:hypothetical protein